MSEKTVIKLTGERKFFAVEVDEGIRLGVKEVAEKQGMKGWCVVQVAVMEYCQKHGVEFEK